MCCFFASLVFFGPRLAFLVYWLFPAGQVRINLVFNTFIWPLLGLIFLPWTTLMYVLIFPIAGFDWLWLGIALLLDIASYGGGAYNRRRVPGYTGP
jgi:hypothetical protein